jgi:hypothetical protein
MKVQPTISSYSPLANFESNKKLRNIYLNLIRKGGKLVHYILFIAKITKKENTKGAKK